MLRPPSRSASSPTPRPVLPPADPPTHRTIPPVRKPDGFVMSGQCPGQANGVSYPFDNQERSDAYKKSARTTIVLPGTGIG